MALTLALSVAATSAMAQEPRPFKGISLAEALELLQAKGLRIVFSSAVVTGDLRVVAEPRAAATPRVQLDELLAPHQLVAREGPGGTLQVVRAEPTRRRSARRPHGSIEGHVIDARTDALLSHVLIEVEGHPIAIRTDAAGRFLLERIPLGAQTLTLSAPGYLETRASLNVEADLSVPITVQLIPAAHTHTEYIAVTDSVPYRTVRGVASELSLDRGDISGLHGSLAEDPLRAIQAFPGVSAVDDFSSEFAVRGSPFRHVSLVVDGVPTQWLLHTARGRGATGSLTMLSGLFLQSATLRAGAYPRRHGDRLGPELEVTLREGSRTNFATRMGLGGSHGFLLAEGPLARNGAGTARGSWLVSARQSYLEWPPASSASPRAAFGFSDAMAKVVFDVRSSQQIALTAIGGRSHVDDEDHLAPNELADGSNEASVFSVSWRSTFGPAFSIGQQAFVVTQRFRNEEQSGRETDRGRSRAVGYRADVTRPVAGGLLEAGAQVQRTRVFEVRRAPLPGPDRGSAWTGSGFAHFARAIGPSFTLSPGVRVVSSTLVRRPAVSRWLLAEWSFRRGWTLLTSAGTSRQLPEVSEVMSGASPPELRAERAAHVELGIDHQLTGTLRWQATAFNRREADVLSAIDRYPRVVDDGVVFSNGHHYSNALQGTSRGIELMVSRRSARGLSGWASYTYARTRHTDTARDEHYWADHDQRHTINVFAVYRFARPTSVGATFRTGSNVPIPGYFTRRDGRLLIGSARNQVRLPAYARLDVRADRQLDAFGHRLTLFVEALNVLNRANEGMVPIAGVRGGSDGLAGASIDLSTREVAGLTETLLRRRLSAGVVIEF
jgi:hypothetical protein